MREIIYGIKPSFCKKCQEDTNNFYWSGAVESRDWENFKNIFGFENIY